MTTPPLVQGLPPSPPGLLTRIWWAIRRVAWHLFLRCPRCGKRLVPAKRFSLLKGDLVCPDEDCARRVEYHNGF